MKAIIIGSAPKSLVLMQQIPLDQHPAAVYLAGLSPRGRSTMRQALDVVAETLAGRGADALTCNSSKVRFQHAAALRARLNERYAPATVNKMLSALRGTLKAAWRLGYMSAEQYHLAASVENVKAERLPAGRHVASGELSGLMGVCCQDTGPAGVRDAAVIGLLYACGLRRAEIIALDLEHFNVDTGELRVRGKRDKERLSHVVNGAANALVDWLLVRGDDPGPLFHPIRKGGAIQRRRMTSQAIYDVLRKRARQAGVKELSPHDLRRTFAGDLLDAGADLVVVQKLMGHASPLTTSRYDRRP